jgi:Spy/CpxP family protein refolding chaperone
MSKIKFSELDSSEKRAVFWLAEQVEALTAYITAAASHTGEIWEAANFMREYTKGSMPHTTLAERLKLGRESGESITDCIKRAAPAYRSLVERADAELDELLYDFRNAAAGF